MGGHIGQFAMEMAHEWADDLGLDLNDPAANSETGVQDMFMKLVKDPTKLFGLIKKVGDRFKEKLASGEMSEEDVKQEAKELFEKLKGMKIPGLEKIQALLSLLLGGGGRGGRGGVAAAAAAAGLNLGGIKRQMDYENIKEKLRQSRERLNRRAAAAPTPAPSVQTAPKYTDEEIVAMFKTPHGTKHGAPADKKRKHKK